MTKTHIKKVSSIFLSAGLAVFLTGCAKDNLLLKTYSPPEQMDKVKELMAKTTSSVSYLDVYINEDLKPILNGKTSNTSVAQLLLENVKTYLTQTNFIGINQNGDSNTISLEMKVVAFSYKATSSSIDAFMEVSFSFIKDENAKPIFTKLYKTTVNRKSSAGKQSLPSESQILSTMTKNLASDLVMDVSPLKARKMVTLKSLPKELEYTIQYAKMGNYKGAIKAMNKYKGSKDMNFYFNLAVYYEALASKSNDLSLLQEANDNYEMAMQMGGTSDDVVIKAKAKFDNFYELIKSIDEQKKSNKKADMNSGDEVL